ncbi:TRAP transporter small permease [Fulvivirga sedimenti]|uniref:TRAP transporter small permease n=1 Tax=Fulvivirga sedimenti TaxID=2879465 RepID=A0A9X1KZA1_9BACT|nr:TRAP transporter small permease [Fulvivirga sedimenti]MCA6078693.1 TRAP transporter small permease [Fulvivirga sedimenti]
MRERVDSILARILVILMGIMVLNVLWQVFSRYVLNDPSSFTDELAGFLMIWTGLLGAAFASGKGLHLAIDIVQDMSNDRWKTRLDYIINSLVIVFALTVLTIGGGRLVYLTLYLEQYSANLNIPVGYVYIVLPLSGILIVYYSISNIIKLKYSGDGG